MWAALGCLGFSLLLSLNRALNRRALSGGRKCEYDWPREIVVVTGGISKSPFCLLCEANAIYH